MFVLNCDQSCHCIVLYDMISFSGVSSFCILCDTGTLHYICFVMSLFIIQHICLYTYRCLHIDKGHHPQRDIGVVFQLLSEAQHTRTHTHTF